MRVVVVGGGIGGLGAALACARSGHEVTILERDDTPMPADAEAAFAWVRTGAPKCDTRTRFSHVCGTCCAAPPDVLDALLAAGATEISFTANLPPTLADTSVWPGDEELVAIACRRTTFEWVLHQLVLAEPGVELRHGVAASALDARRATVPHVVGVDGVAADLVVDARDRVLVG